MSTASPHIPLVATIPHWPHTSAPLPDAQHRHRHHAKRNQLHNKKCTDSYNLSPIYCKYKEIDVFLSAITMSLPRIRHHCTKQPTPKNKTV